MLVSGILDGEIGDWILVISRKQNKLLSLKLGQTNLGVVLGGTGSRTVQGNSLHLINLINTIITKKISGEMKGV